MLELNAVGVTNAAALRGGFLDWKAQGFPTESTPGVVQGTTYVPPPAAPTTPTTLPATSGKK